MSLMRPTPQMRKPRLQSASADTGTLLKQVQESLDDASNGLGRVAEQRRLGHERRSNLEAEVTELVVTDADRLRSEEEKLEIQLAACVRQIHDLEMSNMDLGDQRRAARQRSQFLSRSLQKSEDVSEDTSKYLGDVNELLGMGKKLENKVQGIEGDLRHAYKQKDRIEAELSRHRHAAAITEALHRSRAERACPLPAPSVSDAGQGR